MTTTHEVLAAALGLPERERAQLAHELLVSLDAGEDDGADQAWVDEIERRMREVDDGTAILEDWSSVRDGIASRLRTLKR